MVAFSNVLDTLGFARFRRRTRAPVASDDDATLSAPRCTPVLPQTYELSDSVTEGLDFESAKIATPDGPWERRWPRLAHQPDEAHAASPATLVAAQAQRWDAGAGAVALTISAVLLEDSIPPDARKRLRRGLRRLDRAIAADDTAPASQVPLRFQPFTSPARDRHTRPSIARWLLDYGPDGGVHRHLARAGALLFDIAEPGDEVLFRPSDTPAHVPVHISRFRCAAVEPRVRALVVLSRQFPWEVVVHASAEDGYVRFGDVLSRMREVAREEMRGPEFRFALQTPGGRRRLGHVWARAHDAEPPRRVDCLGQHTILGSLRMDVQNATLREFTAPQWLPGTEKTLYLVAEFVSPADVRAMLDAGS